MWYSARDGTVELDATFQVFNPGLETFHNLANAAHLVEFDLELINLVENGTEAGDFGVCHLDGVPRTVVLNLSGRLCLLRELVGPMSAQQRSKSGGGRRKHRWL